MTAPKHWSYSSWSTFDRCPYLYQQSYITGNRSPQGPSAARGERIHKLSEYYLKGKITGGVPKILSKLAPEFVNLRMVKPVVEEFWGVDANWKFQPGRSWCVMKMDAAVLPTKRNRVLDMIDIKTGKEYPEHAKQGELYITIGAAKHPEIESASSEFWYTDLGYIVQREYTAKEIKELIGIWQERGLALMSLKKFPKTPSRGACQWCHLRTDRGGSCKEWMKVYD